MGGRDVREYPLMTYCPYGHPLTGGKVLQGWVFCQCRPALDGRRGHITVLCLVCQHAGLTMVAYDPPHVRSAAEVRRELETLQFTLTRARDGLASSPAGGPGRARLAGELARLERGAAEKITVVEARGRHEAGQAGA